MFNSSITISSLKEIIDKMCPIRIYLDGKTVWDDDESTLDEYNELFEREDIVHHINFSIVYFHHSIIWIYTKV